MRYTTSLIALGVALLSHTALAAPNYTHDAAPAAWSVREVNHPQTPTASSALTVDDEKKKNPPNQIELAIRTVTKVSNDINIALEKVTTTLTFGDLTSIGATAVQGFSQIVADIGNAIAMAQHTPIISGGVADTVVEVLVGFVKVHQALLNTVIGKHSIFAQFGLTAPLAAILRAIEAGVDGFAFAIISIIPTKKPIIQQEIAKLDVTIKSSITVYNQICLPSLTYPKTLPICLNLGL